ncbi:hypothetical protein ABK040_005875 [Willaertia magna]
MTQNLYSVEKGNFIKLNFNHKIKEIVAKKDNILILTTNGDVYHKGILSDYINQTEFTNLTTKIKKIGFGDTFAILLNELNEILICGSINLQLFKTFTKIYTLNNIKFITCGADIAILITTNNEIFIFGCYEALTGVFDFVEDIYFKKFDILKDNFIGNNIKDLQCAYNYSILLDDLGNVYGGGKSEIFGFNSLQKEFKKLNLNFKVKQIAVYYGGILLLNYNNELFGCGDNSRNQLLLDSKYVIKEFTKLKINENLIIKKIFKSDYKSNIILTNNGFYVIGEHNCFLQKKYTKFTKLQGNNFYCKYKTAIMMSKQLLIIESDYKINDNSDKSKKIYKKLYLQQCCNSNLYLDITFNF